MRRLLLPAIVGMRIAKFTGLQKLAEDISSVRSRIVHQGEFLDEEASVIVIEKAHVYPTARHDLRPEFSAQRPVELHSPQSSEEGEEEAELTSFSPCRQQAHSDG